jgi:hypothetical protein
MEQRAINDRVDVVYIIYFALQKNFFFKPLIFSAFEVVMPA